MALYIALTMVHTIVAGKQVEGVLKDLRASKQIQVGLLIGQVRMNHVLAIFNLF